MAVVITCNNPHPTPTQVIKKKILVFIVIFNTSNEIVVITSKFTYLDPEG